MIWIIGFIEIFALLHYFNSLIEPWKTFLSCFVKACDQCYVRYFEPQFFILRVKIAQIGRNVCSTKTRIYVDGSFLQFFQALYSIKCITGKTF